MTEDISYYKRRLDFLAMGYLHKEISLELIEKNQDKIVRLMDDYLEVSKIPETTDDLPFSFLILKWAIDRVN